MRLTGMSETLVNTMGFEIRRLPHSLKLKKCDRQKLARGLVEGVIQPYEECSTRFLNNSQGIIAFHKDIFISDIVE